MLAVSYSLPYFTFISKWQVGILCLLIVFLFVCPPIHPILFNATFQERFEGFFLKILDKHPVRLKDCLMRFRLVKGQTRCDFTKHIFSQNVYANHSHKCCRG